MKWFKHDSNANMDAKLQEVLLDYGLEGYGLYWYCIELIASSVEKDNLTFELEHDARIIARNTGSTLQKTEEMMKRFVDLGLFECSEGVISCLKLAKRTDEYTTKITRKIKSGHSPDKIPPNRIEENRTDKIKIEKKKEEDAVFEEFWNIYDKKQQKPKCISKWKKLTKSEIDLIFTNLPKYIESTPDKSYRKNPLTWLNGECWNDEIINQPSNQPKQYSSHTEQNLINTEGWEIE